MGAADSFYGSYHQAILMHYYVTASIVDGVVLLILIFCQKNYYCVLFFDILHYLLCIIIDWKLLILTLVRTMWYHQWQCLSITGLFTSL